MSVQVGRSRPSIPLLTLLDPGRWFTLSVLSGAAATIVWGVLVNGWNVSLSNATLIALGIVAVPAMLKWRDDAKAFGLTAVVLSVLLLLQSFHMLEHAAQVVQYYLLDWTSARSLGLIVAANAEWIHFTWNWLVWGCCLFLFMRGMRGVWGWTLMVWATAHSLEHTYLLIRYIQVVVELRALGLPLFDSAQGLPGILGKNGWLAYSSLCGRIAGLTTASRVAVHFWWNVGEFALLLLAANARLPTLLAQRRLETPSPTAHVIK